MKNIVSRINAGVFRLLPGHLGERLIFRGELRKSDVFLVGHPKSGNTWLAFMLAVLVNNDREKLINISNISDFVPTIHGNDQSIRGYKKLQSPRIFRTEAPNYPDSYPRTIYIVRDPRAVLLSYYHHCVHDTCRNDWPISEFVDEMLSVGCIESLEPDLIRWDRQVDAWLMRAKHQPVSIVKYEDLKYDCQNVLHQLSEFIELDSDAELLDIAVNRGDFSRIFL